MTFKRALLSAPVLSVLVLAACASTPPVDPGEAAAAPATRTAEAAPVIHVEVDPARIAEHVRLLS